MNLIDVEKQLHLIYLRTIESCVSIRQNYPAKKTIPGEIQYGNTPNASISLKNVSYAKIYKELDTHDSYHLKLPDGGLMIFQYTFNSEGKLSKHRLGFFPCPTLPTAEEAPDLYEKDELYGDIILEKIVRFPIRFDFDPENYKPKYHAKSHMTLGQFDNCRIPVSHPISPNEFLLFILRNFYHKLYRKHQNILEKKIASCKTDLCISKEEILIPYLSLRFKVD